jgi:hypothetical protein
MGAVAVTAAVVAIAATETETETVEMARLKGAPDSTFRK